jgi:hypothetical protein
MKTLFRGMITGLVATAVFATAQEAAVETEPRLAVVVVVHNYAAVPQEILTAATDVVSRVYRLLGVDIEWNPEPPPDGNALIPTLELRLLARIDKDDAIASVLGVDAPSKADASTRIAHVLYQRVDDNATSIHALAYVMAHVIAGTLLSSQGLARSAFVRADREQARRLMHGAPIFTEEEIDRLRGALSQRPTSQ